jgi:hypothetical protein
MLSSKGQAPNITNMNTLPTVQQIPIQMKDQN